MNIEQVKELVKIATDEDRGGRERLQAFEQADEARKALKIGWSKLGLEVEQVTELKETLPALADMDEADEALEKAPADNPEPEASEEADGTTELTGDASDEPTEQAEAPSTDGEAQERAAAKVKKAKDTGSGEARGGLTRLVESLLMDPALSYLDIINAVIKEFPKANTSARSIASVAAGMRRKGKNVPMRRPAKAEKPAPEAAAAA
jgi:hypothetical protein